METGVLRITEKASKEIDASSVKLEITIEGDNVFFGNAALEKSIEIKDFLKSLEEIKECLNISVTSITIKSDTGWFSKSSKGIYNLCIKINNLSNLNFILGTIAETKNVELREIDWIYDEEESKLELIKKAIIKAKHKAEEMMKVIDYRIAGIRSCSDSYEIPSNKPIKYSNSSLGGDTVKMKKMATSAPLDIGTEIIGKKEIICISSIEFYIEPKN